MGNNESHEEREYKYRELYNGIYIIENDILQDLNNYYKNKEYKTYGLINKDLCKKYPYLLNSTFDYNATKGYNFKNKDLPHTKEIKNFNYIHKGFSFAFPTNFLFINEDFMNVLQNNVKEDDIKARLISKYDTIIGGGCLIMKSPYDFESKNPFRFIILYNEIKDTNGNEIDFFLYIENKDKREEIVTYIMINGLWNFFNEIGYSYKDEYKHFNEGYIVRSCPENRIKTYLKKSQSKTKMPAPSPSDVFSPAISSGSNQKKMPNMGNFITSINTQTKGTTPEHLLNALLLGLFQIKPLKMGLNNNQNLNFISFKEKIVNMLGNKLGKFNSPFNLLNEIISKLETFFGMKDIKYSFDQAEQFDGKKRKEKFLTYHINGNILQKYILIPKEEKINCTQCFVNSYQYKYERFIYINKILKKGLSELIFVSYKEDKLSKVCNFCNGRETKCVIENKIIDFPRVLIIVIAKNYVNTFSFKDNVNLSNNDNSISYSLNHFIEAETNSFYFICKGQEGQCQKFENNQLFNLEKVINKKPITLFYYLTRKNNNISMQQQQQNINMQNNINNMNINSPNNFMMNNFNNQGNNQQVQSNNMNMPSKPNNIVNNMNSSPNNPNMTANNRMKANQIQNKNNLSNNMFRNNQAGNFNLNQIVAQNQNAGNPNQNPGNGAQNLFQGAGMQNHNFGMNQFNPASKQNFQMANQSPVMNNNINMQNNFAFNFQNNLMMQNQNQHIDNSNQMNMQNQSQNQMNQNLNMNNQNQINMFNQNFNMPNQINGNQNINMPNQNAFFQNNNFQNNQMPMSNNNNINNNNQNQNINMNMNNQMNNNINMNYQNINMNNQNINMNNQNVNMNTNNQWNINNQNINMNNQNVNMNMNNQMNNNMNNANSFNNNNNMNNFNLNNNLNFGMNNINPQLMNHNGMINNNNVMIMNMNNNGRNNFANNNQNINFINNNMNNFNMNQNPNFNNNANNQNNPQNNQKQETNKKDEIFVTFTFKKNGEQIYIDVDKNEKFGNAINILQAKYNWLTKIIKKKYYLGKKEIKDFNKTLTEIGIKDNSDIIIEA